MTSKEVTTDVTGVFYLSLQGRVQTNKNLGTKGKELSNET
jgi:hypothetical protein